jgi:ankyrin repeat protein
LVIVQLLLDHHADPSATDNFGDTPLYFAADNGEEHAVTFMIEKGADVSAKNIYGQTPLCCTAARFDDAAWNGHLLVASMLLEQGADVLHKDIDGDTSLHGAAEYGHYKMVSLLLNKGADVFAVNNFGKTPLDVSTNRIPVPVWKKKNAQKGRSTTPSRGHGATTRGTAACGRETPGYMGCFHDGATRTAWCGFYHQ